jgi:VanZ family protein
VVSLVQRGTGYFAVGGGDFGRGQTYLSHLKPVLVLTTKDARKTTAWPLALFYIALVVYASLYPFDNWRNPGVLPWVYLSQPLPKYWTWFDVFINIGGYAPLGFLGVLTALRTGNGKFAVVLVTFLTFLLAMCLEGLQSYLPSRRASNVDLLLNAFGGWLGGITAWGLEKLGAIDRWSNFRRTWFVTQARGALVLLALWPVALFFPASVPLGLGQVLERVETSLGEALSGTPFLEWLPMRTVELQPLLPGAELLCVLLGALIPVLMAYSVLRNFVQKTIFLIAILTIAIGATAISAGLTYGPEHALAWLILPVKLGLVGALVAGVLCLFMSARSCIALLLLALVVQLFVLNLAPASVYFAQTLQTWEQGRFIRFHGVVQWLGWLWPFVAVGYVMGRISKPIVN